VIARYGNGVLFPTRRASGWRRVRAVREVVVHQHPLPIPDEKRFPQLTVLSIAPLIAPRDPARCVDDGSVTQPFSTETS